MVVMAEVVPSRTDAQRMVALEYANEVRVHRARLKDEWRESRPGWRSPAQVIEAPHPHEESWKVFALILALPKVGRVKANKVLQTCRISPSKTVGGLSDRQRGELLAMLKPYLSRCGGTVRA